MRQREEPLIPRLLLARVLGRDRLLAKGELHALEQEERARPTSLSKVVQGKKTREAGRQLPNREADSGGVATIRDRKRAQNPPQSGQGGERWTEAPRIPCN